MSVSAYRNPKKAKRNMAVGSARVLGQWGVWLLAGTLACAAGENEGVVPGASGESGAGGSGGASVSGGDGSVAGSSTGGSGASGSATTTGGSSTTGGTS